MCPWCAQEKVLQGETVRREVRSPRGQRWFSVVNTPIHHSDGTVSQMALLVDITSQKTAVDRLRRNEHMLKNILSASPLGISYFERGKAQVDEPGHGRNVR